MSKIAEKIIFDMTGFESSIISLEKLTNIKANKIVRYILEKRHEYDVDEFLEKFDVGNEKLLSKELEIVSLHVTTSFDDLVSVKEFGLINLQQVVSYNTPFNCYLKEKGIFFDIEKKELHHKEKVIDISKEWNGLEGHGFEKQLNWVIYKLFFDHQISAFFYTPNALKYGGNVNEGPEFLINLSRLLKDNSIKNDWKYNPNKKCYVIKFFTPFSDYEIDSFYSAGGLNRDSINFINEKEILCKKIKALIDKGLRHIHYFLSHRIDDCYSYLRPNVSVPFERIIDIYTEEEYLDEYNIRE